MKIISAILIFIQIVLIGCASAALASDPSPFQLGSAVSVLCMAHLSIKLSWLTIFGD